MIFHKSCVVYAESNLDFINFHKFNFISLKKRRYQIDCARRVSGTTLIKIWFKIKKNKQMVPDISSLISKMVKIVQYICSNTSDGIIQKKPTEKTKCTQAKLKIKSYAGRIIIRQQDIDKGKLNKLVYNANQCGYNILLETVNCWSQYCTEQSNMLDPLYFGCFFFYYFKC